MISHINPSYEWDPSPQGYNNNLDNSALYSAAFGYNFSKLISADIEYVYRPSFKYSKYQTSTAVDTANFVGNKIREFDLASNSLMANLYIHGAALSERLTLDIMNRFMLAPFVGGGIGVGFNTVSNFHSFRPNGSVSSLMADQFKTSFAWQLSAGLELFNDSAFSFTAGYRYYNGGAFQSNYYFLNFLDKSQPLKSTLQSNEFFVTMSYKIDA